MAPPRFDRIFRLVDLPTPTRSSVFWSLALRAFVVICGVEALFVVSTLLAATVLVPLEIVTNLFVVEWLGTAVALVAGSLLAFAFVLLAFRLFFGWVTATSVAGVRPVLFTLRDEEPEPHLAPPPPRSQITLQWLLIVGGAQVLGFLSDGLNLALLLLVPLVVAWWFPRAHSADEEILFVDSGL